MDPESKGVGATFCSKTGLFSSCGCSKPSGVPVCPRRPKPHSAAKQSRSFRVALNSASPSINLEKYGFFRVAALNPSGLLGLGVLGSKNGPWSARVCPKGSGPHSAAKFCRKTGPFSAPRPPPCPAPRVIPFSNVAGGKPKEVGCSDIEFSCTLPTGSG